MAVGAGCGPQSDAADQLWHREIQLDRGERGWAPPGGHGGQSHGHPLERSDPGSLGWGRGREALSFALGPRADAALWNRRAFLFVVTGRRGWAVAISERRSAGDLERSYGRAVGTAGSLLRWPPGRVCATAKWESRSARRNKRRDRVPGLSQYAGYPWHAMLVSGR